jgi:hypothetical protein
MISMITFRELGWACLTWRPPPQAHGQCIDQREVSNMGQKKIAQEFKFEESRISDHCQEKQLSHTVVIENILEYFTAIEGQIGLC